MPRHFLGVMATGFERVGSGGGGGASGGGGYSIATMLPNPKSGEDNNTKNVVKTEMLKKKSKDDEDDEDDEVTRRVRAPVNISRVPAWSDPAPASILQGWWVFSSPRPRARDCRKPRKVTMGTVPFLVYSGVLVCDNPIGIYI